MRTFLLGVSLLCSACCACDSNTGGQRGAPTSDPQADIIDTQIERYNAQLDKVDEQMAQLDQQSKRYDAILAKWEEEAARVDRLLDGFEQFLERVNTLTQEGAEKEQVSGRFNE